MSDTTQAQYVKSSTASSRDYLEKQYNEVLNIYTITMQDLSHNFSWVM